MFSCLLLKQILLVVLTGSFTSYAETVIQGKVGENITLPCHYSVKDYGLTDTCWGRSCPLVGSCPNKMISINENLEIDGQLEKFHLMGNVSQGDVSLTIVNITKDDMGTYCCRMEYQGLFNDGKMFFKLLIEEASLHTTPIYFSTSNFVSEPKWIFITESPVNVTQFWVGRDVSQDNVQGYYEEYSCYLANTISWICWELDSEWTCPVELPENISLYMSTMVKKQGKNPLYRIGLYIGIGACAIIFIIIILLIIKWYLHKKQKKINSASQVAFSNSAARGVQNVLNADVHAPENIYHCS